MVAEAFAIETARLRKHYDGVEAVRDLTLQVPAGSIFGFLGRNGAGKTTTIKMLLGAELLILDEPTSGLDPAMIEEVLQTIVSHVARESLTVFFSSHQIAEVDQIADHIAIVDRGRAVVAGALDDLRENFRRVQLVFDGDTPHPSFRSPGIVRVQRDGRVLAVLASAGAERIVDE